MVKVFSNFSAASGLRDIRASSLSPFMKRSKQKGPQNSGKLVTKSQHYKPELPHNPPVISEVIPTPNDDSKTHCKPDQTPRWKVLLEVAVFCIGAYAVFVYKGQWDASLAANKMNASNFRKSERAWVIPFDTEMRQTKDGRIYFDLIMKNTGKTPALRFRGIMAGTSNLSDIPATDPDNSFNETIVPPESPYRFSTRETPLTEIDLAPNRAGKPFMLYGTIRYEDIFGVSHWLQFCDQTWGTLTDFSPCPIHNKPDDQYE